MHPKNAVLVNAVVNDMLVVEVAQPIHKPIVFEYKITDMNSKTVRKGNFTGSLVQISTRFFNEGMYYLCITQPLNGTTDVLSFRKKAV